MESTQRGETPRVVVGVGASAGGLEALEGFLRAVPGDTGMAFVIVQHLSPDHKSHMVELLTRHTTMRVLAAEDGMALEPNTVYLIPPKKILSVRGNALRLEERGAGLALPVDVLFRSLAEELGERAAGVVLSGTGSDGMRGARALHEAGGLVIVQEPATAKFDGMPRAAISLGIADYVLPVTAMAETLERFITHSERARTAPILASSIVDDALEQLLGLLRRQTGVDFGKYKTTTISRRIKRRMAIHQADTLADYVRIAHGSQREVNALFKELLISVTKFFRDPDAYEVLRREVVPAIVEKTRPGEGIRVWVAGCATGEEAYSIAMLFDEYFESGGRPRDVKIFATDIDRDALEIAGAGVYPETIAADVTPERLNRFFVRHGDTFQVARFLRQRVVFANHDLTRDPPFSRVSLIACRNLLIYLTQEMQAQVMSGFRFGLRPGGFLFLGSSETPGELGSELQTVNPSAKVYRRTDVRSDMRADVRSDAIDPRHHASPRVTATPTSPPPLPPDVADAYDVLVRAYAPPSALITEQHEVLHLFGEPSPLLRFSPGAVSLNLLQLLPPPVASVVGIATHRALRDDGVARYDAVSTELGLVTVSVRAVSSNRAGRRLFVASFLVAAETAPTMTLPSNVPADAERQIVDLQHELRFSRENLQSTIEELETANEELQATNEELVASNEELQSTNEELQSVNEELHTLNAEYQEKIAELVRLSDDINNLLLSTRLGCLFLDANLNITRFTPAITQVMNLLERDIGRPVSHLSLKFDADFFFRSLDEVIRTRAPIERAFELSADESFVLRVAPYVAEAAPSSGLVVTVLDVTLIKRAERRIARVLDALPHQVALLDREGTIRLVNRAWLDFASENGGDPARTGVGVNYLAVCADARGIAPEAQFVASRFSDLLAHRVRRVELEYPCNSPNEERWFLMQATTAEGGEGVVVSHLNITARKQLERKLAGGAA